MRAIAIATAAIALASCHLAETTEQSCAAGYHADLGRCVVDSLEAGAGAITITAAAGGTSCTGDPAAQRGPTVSPDPLHLASGVAFHFENDDAVDHEIRGLDGQVWASVASGKVGPDQTIVKPGSWGYTISGCKGGTVIVQ